MKLYEFFSVPEYGAPEHQDVDKPNYTSDEGKFRLEEEIYWSILDDDYLHKAYFLPLAKTIKRQQQSQKYEHGKFLKNWMPMVEAGCLEFFKQHKMPGNRDEIIDKELKLSLCRRLAKKFQNDISKDEYNLGD